MFLQPIIYDNWNNNNDLRKSFQEQNDRVNNNFEDILQRQQLPSDANKVNYQININRKIHFHL